MNTIILAIGIVGALVIFYAFFMLQLGKWKEDDLKYDTCNFIGSSILAIYGAFIGGWPFVALNIVWAVFSVRDMVFDYNKKTSGIRGIGKRLRKYFQKKK